MTTFFQALAVPGRGWEGGRVGQGRNDASGGGPGQERRVLVICELAGDRAF